MPPSRKPLFPVSELLKEALPRSSAAFRTSAWTMGVLVTVVSFFFLGAQAQNEWTYSGPGLIESNWPKEYPDCGGQRQSPINLQTKKVKFNRSLKPLILKGYGDDNLEFSMTNNGHTVQLNLPPTMQVTDSEGTVYTAKQMHLHWGGDFFELSGSEHTVDGIRRVIEIHVVHFNSKYGSYDEAKSKPDGLAVLAVFIEIDEYAENTYYSPIISELLNIQYPGEATTLINVSIQDLFPGDTHYYYTYKGSLTTPPCTENVKWFVFKDSVKLSKTQVLKIENTIKNRQNETLHNIYRQVQPLNHRVVEANFPHFPEKTYASHLHQKEVEEKFSQWKRKHSQ
ncbi:carbonic anhydrase 6 [Mesocricetus auratus]|uniref:Carbonic anhydrase 6 n=1 Tax=Mesocricetus auratus TaxID=10036 RepID=A0ABM2WJQ1_MESAU|nr:carbonic anhydrase 6 [Mesocricetus auratus]